MTTQKQATLDDLDELTAPRVAVIYCREETGDEINQRIRDGIEHAEEELGYDVDDDGFLFQEPTEYAKVQNFIREVKKGRAKSSTAEFFGIKQSAVQSILKRSEQNYEIPFDNDEWRVERARVESGEKELPPLDGDE